MKVGARDKRLVAEWSVPGGPQINSRAENIVNDVLSGDRVVTVGAGLPNAFWLYAWSYYCFVQNFFNEAQLEKLDAGTSAGGSTTNAGPDVQITESREHTPAQKRFGEDVAFRPIPIPLGAGIYFKPSPAKHEYASRGASFILELSLICAS